MSSRSRIVVGAGLLLVLAVVAIAAVASGGDDGGAGSTPTTAAPALTTTTLAADGPPIANQGDDLVAVTRSILEYRHWLLQNPKPELLERIIRPQCGCWESSRVGLVNLATKGWRYEPPLDAKPSIAEIRLTDRPAPDQARLYVKSGGSSVTRRVVDPSGKAVEESPPSGPTARIYLLLREDGRWRVSGVSELGPVEE